MAAAALRGKPILESLDLTPIPRKIFFSLFFIFFDRADSGVYTVGGCRTSGRRVRDY
jgi:hypothetical protein